MTRRVWDLEKISENYSIILLDTCALMSPIGYRDFEIINESADFFSRKFKEIDKMSVTESVLFEYSNGSNSRKRINFTNELKDKVLQLSGGERLWYNELYKIYSIVRNRFEIGETDFDFLLSGIVVYEARKKSVALISNDTKMVRPWKFLLFRAGLTAKELGFFIREEEDLFKTIKLPKK